MNTDDVNFLRFDSKAQLSWSLVLFACLSPIHLCTAYNILGVFPTFSKSHYIAGGALMRGLAADGHNVSVISPFPNEKPIANFRHIPVLGIEEAIKGAICTAIQ